MLPHWVQHCRASGNQRIRRRSLEGSALGSGLEDSEYLGLNDCGSLELYKDSDSDSDDEDNHFVFAIMTPIRMLTISNFAVGVALERPRLAASVPYCRGLPAPSTAVPTKEKGGSDVQSVL